MLQIRCSGISGRDLTSSTESFDHLIHRSLQLDSSIVTTYDDAKSDYSVGCDKDAKGEKSSDLYFFLPEPYCRRHKKSKQDTTLHDQGNIFLDIFVYLTLPYSAAGGGD